MRGGITTDTELLGLQDPAASEPGEPDGAGIQPSAPSFIRPQAIGSVQIADGEGTDWKALSRQVIACAYGLDPSDFTKPIDDASRDCPDGLCPARSSVQPLHTQPDSQPGERNHA